MGWNEPKRTQKKTLDQKTNSKNAKYIQNNPIWAKNDLEWALVSSNFNKILPVMHISVRHDIIYNFSSGVINVKNKEKKFFL